MGSRGWDVQVRTHATGLDDQFERGQRTNHCGVGAGALTVQHHDLRVAYARNQISLIRGLVVLDLDFDSLSQPLKTGYPREKVVPIFEHDDLHLLHLRSLHVCYNPSGQRKSAGLT
jgi:hypothetical protein